MIEPKFFNNNNELGLTPRTRSIIERNKKKQENKSNFHDHSGTQTKRIFVEDMEKKLRDWKKIDD